MSSSLVPEAFSRRISEVRTAMRSREVDGLLVTHRPNIHYLTGFAGSSGWVLVSSRDIVLLTDGRYIERARIEQPWLQVELAADALADVVSRRVSSVGIRRLGFESEHMSYARARALRTELAETHPQSELASADGIVEALRMVKDEYELGALARATALVDAALSYAVGSIVAGMTELEAAWSIERWLRENGSGSLPFPVIVASGPNSALPHAEPGERALRTGEPIVIDVGATFDGYCSDLTRTVFLGEMSPEHQDLYRTVLSAQSSVLQWLRSGVLAADADNVARTVISSTKYSGMFVHGLGHGVGLEVHEGPVLNSRSEDTLLNSMVFTVEPGIYMASFGGVRIEDTVVLRNNSAVALTQFDKNNPVIH